MNHRPVQFPVPAAREAAWLAAPAAIRAPQVRPGTGVRSDANRPQEGRRRGRRVQPRDRGNEGRAGDGFRPTAPAPAAVHDGKGIAARALARPNVAAGLRTGRHLQNSAATEGGRYIGLPARQPDG